MIITHVFLRKIVIALMMTMCTVTSSAQQTYHGDGPDDWLRYIPLASAITLLVLHGH